MRGFIELTSKRMSTAGARRRTFDGSTDSCIAFNQSINGGKKRVEIERPLLIRGRVPRGRTAGRALVPIWPPVSAASNGLWLHASPGAGTAGLSHRRSAAIRRAGRVVAHSPQVRPTQLSPVLDSADLRAGDGATPRATGKVRGWDWGRSMDR